MAKAERDIGRAWLRSVEKIRAKLSTPELEPALALNARRTATDLVSKSDVLDSMREVRDLTEESGMTAAAVVAGEINDLGKGK